MIEFCQNKAMPNKVVPLNLSVTFPVIRRIPMFEVWVSPVLMQNPDVQNFHGPLTLLSHCVNMIHFFILFGMGEKCLCLKYGFHLYQHKIQTFEIFMVD